MRGLSPSNAVYFILPSGHCLRFSFSHCIVLMRRSSCGVLHLSREDGLCNVAKCNDESKGNADVIADARGLRSLMNGLKASLLALKERMGFGFPSVFFAASIMEWSHWQPSEQ